MKSLAQVQQAIRAGEVTLPQLVQQSLAAIEKYADYNMYIEVYAAEALTQAAMIQEKIAQQTAGPLAGMILGIKDVLCYQDHVLTAGSKILDGFRSLFTATALSRVLAADAVIIGRQNCDEFAMGSSNENSAYGPVKNPLDPTRVPGGSSGGSAAAVAAETCLAALGSDTGGSIRQPAAYCGLCSIKPTYGRVSRYGLVAYASSFDQISPIAHSIEDLAILLEIIAGEDPNDNTSSSMPVPAYSKALAAGLDRPLRLGVIREALELPGLDPEIREGLHELIEKLRLNGHIVEWVSFPYIDYLVPTYYVLTTAEASSNLSRYDGIRYGYRATEAASLENLYSRSRAEGFGAEVKRRILLGTFVLSAGYYDAYYTKAQKVRRLLTTATHKLLENYDALLSPTTPDIAFKAGAKSDPISMYLSDIFTVHANLVGCPAISVPVGKHSSGLPYSAQLLGKPFDESLLFQAAAQLRN